MNSQQMFLTPTFWAAYLLYGLVLRGSGAYSQPWRHGLGVAVSLGFLYAFTPLGFKFLVALFIGLCSLYWLALRVPSARTEGARPVLLVAVTSLLGLWGMGKIAASVPITRLSWIYFVGFSFLVVKAWSFLKDMSDGRIMRPNLTTFLHYCLYFPCFISGPMHFYSEFEAATERPVSTTAEQSIDALLRITWGLVKVLVLQVALRPYCLTNLVDSGVSAISLARLLLACLAYSIVLYMDFSGYCDIVIGSSSAVLGIEVPENFRAPYLAKNVREFWQRWHITFSRFLTQYLFMPLVRWTPRYLPVKPGLSMATAAYLMTFLFCGFWHGARFNFILWGIYHGLGLAAYDFFSKAKWRRASSHPTTHPLLSPLSRGMAIGGCFLFVSLGWSLFVLPMSFWTR